MDVAGDIPPVSHPTQVREVPGRQRGDHSDVALPTQEVRLSDGTNVTNSNNSVTQISRLRRIFILYNLKALSDDSQGLLNCVC